MQKYHSMPFNLTVSSKALKHRYCDSHKNLAPLKQIVDFFRTVEKSYGHSETRICSLAGTTEIITSIKEWANLKKLFVLMQ